MPLFHWRVGTRSFISPAFLLAVLSSSPFCRALASQVIAWGDNSLGQTNVPPGLTNVIAVSGSGLHNLGLRSDGTVIGWGYDLFGQATAPADLTNCIAISAGTYHSVALKRDGTVTGWGYGGSGQTNFPPNLSNVVAIAAGHHQTEILRNDGTVLQFPSDFAGSGGVPPGLSNVVAIAVAGDSDGDHVIALKSDGSVLGWGANSFGALDFPEGLTNEIAIAAGTYSGFALNADRSVVQWGTGDPMPLGLSNVVSITDEVGLLGTGTFVQWRAPLPPNGLSNVVAVSINVALLGDGPPTLAAAMNKPEWSETQFAVSITSQSGKVYALEYKQQLSETNWIATPLVAGTGGVLVLTDFDAGPGQRFYRVRSW